MSTYPQGTTITYDSLLKYIRELVTQKGSQVAVAKNLGISVGYLNDILHRRRKPGTKLLNALGCERQVIYLNHSLTKE